MRLSVRYCVLLAISLGIQCDLALAASKQVSFTVSRHPDLASPNDLQVLFNQGAALLLSDDDGAGSGTEDDVSFDVQFTLSPAPSATFPDQSANTFPPAERYNYKLPKYNDIANDTVGDQLREATFAKLKQVNSGHDFSGWAKPENKTIIFTQSADRATTVHEWGHNCGLSHRDSSNMNVMYSRQNRDKNEINTTERTAMQNYSH